MKLRFTYRMHSYWIDKTIELSVGSMSVGNVSVCSELGSRTTTIQKHLESPLYPYNTLRASLRALNCC